MRIERSGEDMDYFAHRRILLEPLPAVQEFAIDRADLVQNSPGALMICQKLLDLLDIGLGYVIHLWTFAGSTDGEIVFGTVTTAFGAFAVGFSTAFVALDQRTTESGVQRGELSQQVCAAAAQAGSQFASHEYQTTYVTGLIMVYESSFVKLLSCRFIQM